MEGYFKIGELAKLYDIGTDSIRYYEKLGLITPVRGENGYRLYSINEIWRMNVIRDLRSLGFSMNHIGEYLSQRSVENTIHLLEEELKHIEKKEEKLKQLKKNVHHRLNAIEVAKEKTIGVVEKVYFPKRNCHEIYSSFSQDGQMDLILKQLLNKLHNRLHIIGNTQIGCRMNEASVEKKDFHTYDSVFIVDDTHKDTNSFIKEGYYLTLRYKGNTNEGHRYVPLLFEYAKNHQLTISKAIVELVLIDIHEASNYGEHITELQALILSL